MKNVIVFALVALAIMYEPAHAKNWFDETETRIYAGAWSYHIDAISFKDAKPYEHTKRYYDPETREILYTEKTEIDPPNNQVHNLVGIEYKRFLLAYMKNTFNDDSVALGLNVYQKEMGNFTGKVFVGAVYGYRNGCWEYYPTADKVVCPLVVPMVTYDKFETVQPYAALFGNALTFGFSKKF